MAESNFVDERLNNEKFQSVVRRKLDRFRSKLAEMFFSTPQQAPVNTQQTLSSNFTNTKTIEHAKQQQPDDNSMLISNCYYGYTSPITEDDLTLFCKKKSKKFHKNITSYSSSTSSSSSAFSSSSSMIIDDDEHSTLSNFSSQPHTGDLILSQFPVNFDSHSNFPQSLTSGVITLNKTHHHQQQHNLEYYSFNSQLNTHNSNYDTSSLNTNEEENPFLNKRLTDQIHFNSDLNVLISHFESSLDLIDDQDNFFNIEFMTSYISYILLKQINESNLLKQIKWDLKLSSNSEGRNLLKDIAEQIFLESRDEPCGLKGCNISIFVQTVETQYDEPQQTNTLVSKFQFGTSRFGAFDLNLFLKHDLTESDLTNQSTVPTSNSIATLTRRIFSSNSNSTSKQNKAKQLPSDRKTLYLDSNNYDLFKTNLAYE